jgi:hypothetical protein
MSRQRLSLPRPRRHGRSHCPHLPARPHEDMVFVVSKLPWWGGLALALVSYLVLHAMAVRPVVTAAGPGAIGAAVTDSIFATNTDGYGSGS